MSTPTVGLGLGAGSWTNRFPHERHEAHRPSARTLSTRRKPTEPTQPNQPSKASNPNKPGSPDHKNDEELDVKDRTKPVVPRRYKVLFHNDSYTTMEFVVECLITFFHKSETEATHVMLTVHRMGAATAGIYTREVAETKVQQVMDHARKNGMPLMLTAEPE